MGKLQRTPAPARRPVTGPGAPSGLFFIIKWAIMSTSRTIAIMQYTRGGITVVTGERSGERYAFTWKTREQSIDPRDADQFRRLMLHVSSCGCTGGHDLRDKWIKLFEVEERPL